MKHILQKLIALLKKKRVWIPLSVVIIIIISIFGFSGGKKSDIQTVPVSRGTVSLEVSVTGRVKPTRNLDIAFERSGRITAIHTNVGAIVSEGQTLIELDHADLSAQLIQAQANYQSQKIKLDQLTKNAQGSGSTSAKADIDLQTTYIRAVDVLQDAYTKADDAVRTQTTDMFDYDEENTPQVTFMTSATQEKIDAGSLRLQARDRLNIWSTEIQALNAYDHVAVDAVLQEAILYMQTFFDLYDRLQTALNGAMGITATTQTSYKTKLTTGRAALNTALSSLNTAKQNIVSQKTTATNTLDDVEIQKGQVEQARAQVLYYQSQIAKTIIRAPFSGTVTKIPFTKGEIIQPNTTAISLIGSGKYQIETHVTESDVSRIRVGNIARVTLDAYGQGVVFEARVIGIDLSETFIDGVPTYKTTLEFSQDDERILSGLTANIDILSDKKEGVLFIPTRAISISSEGIKSVRVITSLEIETSTSREIQTGLKGSDGRTEVLEGLQEGEYIVTE